jgi:hypothetical protein
VNAVTSDRLSVTVIRVGASAAANQAELLHPGRWDLASQKLHRGSVQRQPGQLSVLRCAEQTTNVTGTVIGAGTVDLFSGTMSHVAQLSEGFPIVTKDAHVCTAVPPPALSMDIALANKPLVTQVSVYQSYAHAPMALHRDWCIHIVSLPQDGLVLGVHKLDDAPLSLCYALECAWEVPTVPRCHIYIEYIDTCEFACKEKLHVLQNRRWVMTTGDKHPC